MSGQIPGAPGVALPAQFNAVFASGHANPLKLSAQDRRWVAVPTPPKKEIK